MRDASDARTSSLLGRFERAEARGPAPLEAPADLWQQRLTIAFEYPVVFTRGLLHPTNSTLAWALGRLEPDRRHRALVVLDEGVARAWPNLPFELQRYAEHHAERVELLEAPRIVPGGERAKNRPVLVEELHAWFQQARMDRHAVVLVMGGGAVLDMVGYAAAITHRGLRLVRIPTTVLAQNDAGIGVKNGVNAFGTKNFLGTFAAPFAVLNDIDFITTLDARERTAGIAEAIKVALIRDAAFFAWLEQNVNALARGDMQATEKMIRRCAELHLEHIRTSGDPFETGSARPLDFGHWAAHKLEVLSKHELRHGEAVAVGMAIDTLYAARTHRIRAEDATRVCDLIATMGLPLWHEALAKRDSEGRLRVLDGLHEFREHLGGTLTITLLEAIGRGAEVHAIDEAHVCAAIEALRSRR